MPLIFIHGVNTRYGDSYTSDVAARDEMIKLKLLEPLAERDSRFVAMDIVNSYWGDLGASFRWNMQSFPAMRALAMLGAEEDTGTSEADAEIVDMANMIEELALTENERVLKGRTGAEPGALQRAASRDPERFVEAVFLPLIRSGRWREKPDIEPEASGRNAAHVLIAADEAARDPKTKAGLKLAKSDRR